MSGVGADGGVGAVAVTHCSQRCSVPLARAHTAPMNSADLREWVHCTKDKRARPHSLPARMGCVQPVQRVCPTAWTWVVTVTPSPLPLFHTRTFSAVQVRVPGDYYDWTLEQRAVLLGSPPRHLCKCVVLENQAPPLVDVPPAAQPPRWLCVVVQYTHRLDLPALADALRSHCTPPAPKRAVKLVVADGEDCFRLTGFVRGAVTVFGLATPVPVRGVTVGWCHPLPLPRLPPPWAPARTWCKIST